MKFLNETHEENYKRFVAGCFPGDRERKSMFFILAGVRKLSDNINKIYDFIADMKRIKDDAKELPFITSPSERALLSLALNLYSSSYPANVADIFKNLDKDNYAIAMEAIRIRFEREYFWLEEEEKDRINQKSVASLFDTLPPFKLE